MVSSMDNRIVGNWIVVDGQVVGDEACDRIESRIENELSRVASRDGGWSVLYLDPSDGTYWEMTHPQGELQGGGPPQLDRLSSDEVTLHYGVLPTIPSDHAGQQPRRSP